MTDGMTDGVQQVREDFERQRFEILVDGEVVGFTAYRRRAGDYAFLHTEIDEAFEGRGLGSVLIRAALETVREQGLGVEPYCPFVLAYLQRHPEFLELVPDGQREKFGLLS